MFGIFTFFDLRSSDRDSHSGDEDAAAARASPERDVVLKDDSRVSRERSEDSAKSGEGGNAAGDGDKSD